MIDKEHETVRIYTGPVMLVKGLVARLNELGISPIERNDNESSIQAGFTIGVPGQVMLYIYGKMNWQLPNQLLTLI